MEHAVEGSYWVVVVVKVWKLIELFAVATSVEPRIREENEEGCGGGQGTR